MADRFGPVCPQNMPDFSSEPGKTMSEGRYNSLKRLLPYLNNQSEDCLYLNIYTPAQGKITVYRGRILQLGAGQDDVVNELVL